MDDQQRARELLDEAVATCSYGEDAAIKAITAALRAAPESVALRVAMQSLEQIANAPNDQGAKFNAMGALRFLQTQPVELRAAPVSPEGFVLVPVEPTKEMVLAACKDHGFPCGDRTVYARGYRSMLAARPQGVK